jgi:hypothetical protein
LVDVLDDGMFCTDNQYVNPPDERLLAIRSCQLSPEMQVLARRVGAGTPCSLGSTNDGARIPLIDAGQYYG